MRITDLPVTTPLTATKARDKKTESGASSTPTLVPSGRTDSTQHPDEVAAAALQKAATSAQATRVVSAENQRASESVRGDIDPRRIVLT